MADTNAAPVRNTEQLTDELVERARAIAPAIAARAETSERDRRVADETIADVAEAGLFEILVPQRYGGHELGISSMVKVMKALSPLDVSTGWTLPSTWFTIGCGAFCQKRRRRKYSPMARHVLGR